MEHFDVLVVGAGISGIGAGYYLQEHCPKRTYAILEGRERMGGTWDLFRYPGIRSDSDMYTLGFSFRPWREAKAIADGPSILKYLKETAAAYGIDKHVRYQHQVTRAAWDSATSTWTVDIDRGPDAAPVQMTCNFLHMCAGYYRYSAGYRPDFPGEANFKGQIIHPQHWPENLDYSHKKVVVIGSGATAVTLVPAMADKAAHVTMLQRSPTYMVSRPAEDALANKLREILPAKLAYDIIRWRNVLLQLVFFNHARKSPDKVRNAIIDGVKSLLPADFDVAKHFSPTYKPWDQRLCLVPDADMFNALSKGSASVVTDHIEAFDETGIKLASGQHLDADIIVTATGLEMQLMSGMEIVVDGKSTDMADTFSYKGMMYSGVPNLASTFGYTNASWTLKADLTAEYVTRLLNHMTATGTTECRPINSDPNMEPTPWLDFSSGYVQRAMQRFPKQGKEAPWKVYQNYAKDLMAFRYGKIDDGVMRFSKATGIPAATKASRAPDRVAEPA
jgi:cation diffusion facilitator CzcD-associated flavoprotein CzcO